MSLAGNEGDDDNQPPSQPLWPIINFKKWILRDSAFQMNQLNAYDSEAAALRELSDYKPNYHLDLSIRGHLFFNIREEQQIATWNRLVSGRIFVENRYNDELERCEFHSTKYTTLQAVIMRLDADTWMTTSRHQLRGYGALVRYCYSKLPDEVLDLAGISSALSEVENTRRFGVVLCQTDMTGNESDWYLFTLRPQMKGLLKELERLFMQLVRISCTSNLWISKAVRFTDEQLRLLLLALFNGYNHYNHYDAEDRTRFVEAVTVDDSPVLKELQPHVFGLFRYGHSEHMLNYLLRHQRGVFDVVHTNDTGHCYTLYALLEYICRVRSRAQLALAHGVRFEKGLPPTYYSSAWSTCERALQTVAMPDNWREPERLFESIYWVIRFGMPLDLRCARSYSTDPVTPPPVPCTLLETAISAMGECDATTRSDRLAFFKGSETAYYWAFMESEKTCILRFLIAENSPPPRAAVFEQLLRDRNLTALFSALYHLFRACVKVMLPEYDASTPAAVVSRPSFYPKLALIIRELIVRGSFHPCPKNFLDELSRIGGDNRGAQVDTLEQLALRTVRRHMQSPPTNGYPRLSADNYRDLVYRPIHGELHLASRTSPYLPPAYITQFNLADLKNSFFAAASEACDNKVLQFVDIS